MARHGRAISLGLIIFLALSLSQCSTFFRVIPGDALTAAGPEVDGIGFSGVSSCQSEGEFPLLEGSGPEDVPTSSDTVTRRVPEFRALWVLRNTLVSSSRIDEMLRQAASSGMNVLFVQVRGRGDALYTSTLAPRSELLSDAGFDPLAYTVARAHSMGLEVHAWLNTFLVWSAPQPPRNQSHILLSRSHWVHVRADGRSLMGLSRPEIEAMGAEGVFIAPGNPDVRTHIRAVVRELVERYDLDGIHLDYVRYPSMEVGYDAATRTEFMRRYGVDPAYLASPGVVEKAYGDAGARHLRALWSDWRQEGVTELVRALRTDLNEVRPSVKLSAAVIAEANVGRTRHAQDWPSWLSEGILDFAVPMCYSASTSFVKKQVGDIKELVGERKFHVGLAMYNQSPARVVEKVRALRRIGVRGFSFFCYDPESRRNHILRELGRTVFSEDVEY